MKKIYKSLLMGVLVGTAAFSTSYIIADKCTTKIDEKFDKINKAFDTLTNAFEAHVSDSLEDDPLDEVYEKIDSNFNILSNSISESKNELLDLFGDQIKTVVDSINQTILDKTKDLDEKIEESSTAIESLSNRFVDIEQSQTEIKIEINSFINEYAADREALSKSIDAIQAEISSINSAADLTSEEIDKIFGMIDTLQQDFLAIDDVRQSVALLENKVNQTIIYLEEIQKISSTNSYNIEELTKTTDALKSSVSDLESKFDSLDNIFQDTANRVQEVSDKFDSLKQTVNINASNTDSAIQDLKNAIKELGDRQSDDINAVIKSIVDLQEKYDSILISNDALKLDIENLYNSTEDIYRGLLELQDGFNTIQDKFNTVPSILIINDDREIKRDSLPTIPLPDIKKIKSISLFLSINGDSSKPIHSNIINTFYSMDGEFVGDASITNGVDYLMKVKFAYDSIDISGFWHKWGIGPWKSLQKNDPNVYTISKLIVTY